MSSTRIHALPLQLANQIAAGEVVERPASVLKELIENSIDAGSTQIDIRIEGAGNRLIKVTDNGSGIHPEDLPLALSRHATSKLLSSEQLSEIGSLGFRGEALPSIASVSHLTLSSKQASQECGWQISINQTQASPTAHPNGTTVSVSELFFNLPARKRFLRSDKTETHHLLTCFQRLALSRFDIGFHAVISENNQFKLPALTQSKDYPQRISKICGQGFLKQANYLEQVYEDIKLTGWVSQPEAHRAQTDIQFFFINGRVIKDRVINHAIRQAYADQLPSGRQAAYVLYLTMPLNKVDVNVHPTKHEVRFRDARLIHGLITKAIQEAIQNQPTIIEQAQLSISEPETNKREPQVNESANHYSVTKQFVSAKPAAEINTDNVNSPILLYQRYLVCDEPTPRLIDLQLAERTLKQKQFRDAISSNSLAARPILVPVDISITAQEQALLKSNQSELESLGFDFVIKSHQIRLTRIPYLLSQVELKELVKGMLKMLALKENSSKMLAELVVKLIPMQPIVSKQQAQSILAQLIAKPNDFKHCFQTLDLDMLSSLFSDA